MFTNPVCHWSGGVIPPLINYAPGDETDPADIQMPVETVFYDTSAALVAAGVPAPTFLHPCQEAAGTGTIADVAGGGLNLTAQGVVYLQGQRCVGLWDPVNEDFHGYVRRSVEAMLNLNCGFIGPDNVLGDPGAGSLAVFFCFRTLQWNTAEYQLLGKKIGGTTAGWNITCFNGTSLRIMVEDTAGVAVNAAALNNFESGSYVFGLATLNRTTGFLRIWTSQEGWCVPVALGALNNVAAAGHPFAFFDDSAGTGGAHAQILYHAAWFGVVAEDIDANWDAIYRPILVPFNTNPCPIGYEVNSVDNESTIVGEDPAKGILIAAWGGHNNFLAGSTQFSWTYDPTITRANKLCHPQHVRTINLISESDRFNLSAWTKTACTIGFAWADMADGPDGFHMAELLTATASPGRCADTNTGVVAGDYYAIGFFVLRGTPMGTNVAGRLVAYDYTNSAEIAAQAFTATTLWQHIWLEFQVPVGCVRIEHRIEIDTDTESIHAFRAYVNRYGYQRCMPSAPLVGYSAANIIRSTGLVPADTIHGAAGEIELQVKGFTNLAVFENVGVLFESRTGVANNNRRHVKISDTVPHILTCDMYDSGVGAVNHVITYGAIDWSVEHKIQVRWNIAGLPSGNTSEIIVDGGAPVAGSVAPWAASDTCDQVAIGGDCAGAASQPAVNIIHCKVWANPQ